jgi:hypothetical protein
MTAPQPTPPAADRPHAFVLYGARDPESTRPVPFHQIGTHPRYPTLSRRRAEVWEIDTRDARPDETPDLWAFWSYAGSLVREPRLSMIWPSRQQFEMCFTYGVQPAVAHGDGEVVTLIITGTRLWLAPSA